MCNETLGPGFFLQHAEKHVFMVLNFKPCLSSVLKQGNPRRGGNGYLPFESAYRSNGCAWETGAEQRFTLQPLQALAAVKHRKC